jgi:hypothetical protein
MTTTKMSNKVNYSHAATHHMTSNTTASYCVDAPNSYHDDNAGVNIYCTPWLISRQNSLHCNADNMPKHTMCVRAVHNSPQLTPFKNHTLGRTNLAVTTQLISKPPLYYTCYSYFSEKAVLPGTWKLKTRVPEMRWESGSGLDKLLC